MPFPPIEREIFFPLQTLPKSMPKIIDARGPLSSRVVPHQIRPSIAPQVAFPSVPVLQPDIQSFAKSLFGCAPERYANLTPDERAYCPKLGEGLAKNDEKGLFSEPRSHAKYEAMWEEQWIEDHWVPTPCLPTPNGIAQCLMDQSIAEHKRAQAAWDKIAADQALALKSNTPSSSIPTRRGQSERNDNLAQ